LNSDTGVGPVEIDDCGARDASPFAIEIQAQSAISPSSCNLGCENGRSPGTILRAWYQGLRRKCSFLFFVLLLVAGAAAVPGQSALDGFDPNAQ